MSRKNHALHAYHTALQILEQTARRTLREAANADEDQARLEQIAEDEEELAVIQMLFDSLLKISHESTNQARLKAIEKLLNKLGTIFMAIIKARRARCCESRM